MFLSSITSLRGGNLDFSTITDSYLLTPNFWHSCVGDFAMVVMCFIFTFYFISDVRSLYPTKRVENEKKIVIWQTNLHFFSKQIISWKIIGTPSLIDSFRILLKCHYTCAMLSILMLGKRMSFSLLMRISSQWEWTSILDSPCGGIITKT